MAHTVTIETESDAMRAIVAWSESCPAWQQDALRRLVGSGELIETDRVELLALCKDSTLPGIQISSEHINDRTRGAPAVALTAIREVQNINALVPNQSLSFVEQGVTVVYGDNGAGKSGYVRVLKRACRARTVKGREEAILSNIEQSETRPQCATVSFRAGGQTQHCSWQSGQFADSLLSEVSVFDSRTASVHVDDTNDVAYTPFPMKVLESLAETCRILKSELDVEVRTLKEQTPKVVREPPCDSSTKVGQLVTSLSAETDPVQVRALAAMDDTEQSYLIELTSDIAQNPLVITRRLSGHKVRLVRFREVLTSLANAISQESLDLLVHQRTDALSKAKAAALASENKFKDEPLSGVGADTWRTLWEAARAYSQQEAYPEGDFPLVAEGSHCVLCQQSLDSRAIDRMTRFELFVMDRTQTEASTANSAVERLEDELIKTSVTHRFLVSELISAIRDEVGLEALSESIRAYVIHARWRLRAMLHAGERKLPANPDFGIIDFDGAISSLEGRISAITADEQSPEQQKRRADLAELNDRVWLMAHIEDVVDEITRLKKIESLNKALILTNPKKVTALTTKLSKALVSDRLRARFNQEVGQFNLGSHAIELQQTTSSQGVARFRVSLMSQKKQKAGEVLSEGEYRCVALAGFLAELATNDSGSGIIFDDPVSSLDHLHREAIARRLAAEGRSRQVIVFTHDLSFLFLLRNACTRVEDSAEATEIALRHVQRLDGGPGYCHNQAPDKARSASQRLEAIRQHLDNTRQLFDGNPDGDQWLMQARGLVSTLRQVCEQAVEDAVSPVLRTFSSKINTIGFSKLSAIELSDAESMRAGYGRCSELLHRMSDELNPSAPTPQQLMDELDALSIWKAAIEDRQNQIR